MTIDSTRLGPSPTWAQRIEGLDDGSGSWYARTIDPRVLLENSTHKGLVPASSFWLEFNMTQDKDSMVNVEGPFEETYYDIEDMRRHALALNAAADEVERLLSEDLFSRAATES